MTSIIVKSDLRNVAVAAAAHAGGSWSTLDMSTLREVGACADYLSDLEPFVVQGDTFASLDPAADTPATAKQRSAKRRYVLASFIRVARKQLQDDTLDLRAYFADIDDKGTRGYVVERVK